MSISIHTFLAEGDSFPPPSFAYRYISIHTFLAEGDKKLEPLEATWSHFNPHLPCGRRHPANIFTEFS